MSKLWLALVGMGMVLGCTETAIPGYQGGAGLTAARAYSVAEDSYKEEAANAAAYSRINELASTVAHSVAVTHGLNYWGYDSEEIATTMLNAEVGPVSDFARFSSSISVLEMFLGNSIVSVEDGDLLITPLHATGFISVQ